VGVVGGAVGSGLPPHPPNPQTPNPQSPIPNPHLRIKKIIKIILNKLFKNNKFFDLIIFIKINKLFKSIY
jgi:hypothetical protein